ncbi:MAG: hypothetical protein KGL39_42360 [Patescibacteria group bacterium]|nr:hypothetical protein [Patescibacteria group bacterium]
MAEKKELFSIPIEWHEVANAPTIFANHLMVQADQHEFYLCFVDIAPPFLEGDTDQERLEALRKVQNVKARPVARIAISADRLENIVTTLRDSLEKFRAMQRAEKGSQGQSGADEPKDPGNNDGVQPKAAG